jgi:hypothetical protein
MSEQPAPAEPSPKHKFVAAMQKILSVPKTEILRREEEYRKQRAAQKQKRKAA